MFGTSTPKKNKPVDEVYKHIYTEKLLRQGESTKKPLQSELVRINGKSDGKNKGEYDGVYVTRTAYDRRARYSTLQKRTLRYDEGEIFFIKQFPTDETNRVEAFCGMLMGLVINQFIDQEFIPPEYAASFCPVEPIKIQVLGGEHVYALKQPYQQGAIPLFQVTNPNQKQKDVVVELANKIVFRKDYGVHLQREQAEQRGLSYIIFLMVMLGNYSLHSGNVLVKITDNEGRREHQYISIDNDAGLRGIFKSAEVIQGSPKWGVFKAIGDRVHKKYLSFYKNIPNLFESSVAHALNFATDNDKKQQLKGIIQSSVTESLRIYTDAFGDESKTGILKYLKSEKCEDLTEDNLGEKIAEVIIDVRLNALVQWRRSDESTRKLQFQADAAYFSKGVTYKKWEKIIIDDDTDEEKEDVETSRSSETESEVEEMSSYGSYFGYLEEEANEQEIIDTLEQDFRTVVTRGDTPGTISKEKLLILGRIEATVRLFAQTREKDLELTTLYEYSKDKDKFHLLPANLKIALSGLNMPKSIGYYMPCFASENTRTYNLFLKKMKEVVEVIKSRENLSLNEQSDDGINSFSGAGGKIEDGLFQTPGKDDGEQMHSNNPFKTPDCNRHLVGKKAF